MREDATIMQLAGVSMRYGSGPGAVQVLRDVDLAIGAGELVAIVGFSGAGKTTLLSIMAGLVEPTAGSVTFLGEPVTGPGPDRGVVFQSYSLMPWLSVEGNIALAVDAVHAGKPKAERRDLVRHYVELVGLAHAIDRRPAELSGGMRQRVAVARALAMSPQMLLLDEPLSALDALTRARLREEIESIWSRERKTAVLITNDVDEAVMLADRIVPLTPGPSATLGPEFRVDLPRPRGTGELNDNVEFRRLRSAITRYLIDTGRQRGATTADREVVLPDVSPRVSEPATTFASARRRVAGGPPRAWVEAATSRPTSHYVEFFNVSKAYPTRQGPLTVVDGFDLRMTKGEIVSLIGHSGCGKSTVLSMIAGLTEVSGGGIVLDGREVTAAGPDRAVVFQAPNLVPWLTAAENVALGVDRVYRHATPAERADIVEYYLTRVGLADHIDRPAAALSSGMKQRVGIARAFALSPKLLLLDEPFGMLDTLTRWELQEQLLDVWSRTRVTAICVTHDVDEALLLADRVVMMTNGPRAKVGKTLDVNLPRPRSRKALLEHPDYYSLRREVHDFLEGCERGDTAAELAA